jgi:hypothetical protein
MFKFIFTEDVLRLMFSPLMALVIDEALEARQRFNNYGAHENAQRIIDNFLVTVGA